MAARSRGQIRSPERPQTIDAARSAQSSHRSSRRRHAGQLTQAAALTGHPPGYPDTRFRRPAPRLRTPTRRRWPARSRPANRNPTMPPASTASSASQPGKRPRPAPLPPVFSSHARPDTPSEPADHHETRQPKEEDRHGRGHQHQRPPGQIPHAQSPHDSASEPVSERQARRAA